MKQLLLLLRNAQTTPALFIGPLCWACLASLFDGISVGMFVPILKGMIEGDFSFIYANQYFGPIFNYLPVLGNETSVVRPLLFLCLLFVFFFVAKVVTVYKAGVAAANVAYELAHRIRENSFRRCISLGKMFFDSNSSGQLHAIITQFSSELSWKLASLLSQIAQLLPVVFYLGIMFAISWKAAAVTILLSPVLLLLRPLYARLSRLSTQLATDNRSVSNILERVLQGIVTVKANSGERFEVMQFTEASREAYESGTHLIQKLYFSHLLTKLLMLGTFALCGGALIFVLHDDIRASASTYLIYLLIMKRAIDVLQQSSHFYAEVQALGGLIGSINELFSRPLYRYELKDGTVPFYGVKEQIQIDSLTFGYADSAPVLHNISFTINRGEIVALVGPSGSGKSTVAQLLLRLYDAPPNTILFDGIDVREYTLETLRDRTAYVSQVSNLFDDTLRNNLCYGISREVTEEEIRAAMTKARLGEFLAALPNGLQTRVGDRGIRISGGEAQRVAIARAILKGVDFFILDEATSALDATTEQQVQEALDALAEDKTVLVIAHRFSTLKNVDKIIAIADGRIVEEGSLLDLLEKDGLFAELWKAQELFV